jgi:uncharacterized protein
MSVPRKLALGTIVVVIAGIAVLIAQLPTLAAGGLLYPMRRHVQLETPAHCTDVTFQAVKVSLKGWRCRAAAAKRGTIVYLHGVGDNRVSATGIIERFTTRGFDVIAYDSRAHGESTGEICTYGYFEKQDLRRVLDTLRERRTILIGTSMGAAVALQAAGEDSRVAAVVAAEAFSDLRTISRDRAPFFLNESSIAKAFELAEQRGRFKVDDVDVVASAKRIRVPVLLIHGAEDRDTFPEHSKRVFAALAGPKRLIIVSGAHHNQSLNATTWVEVERWIDEAL